MKYKLAVREADVIEAWHTVYTQYLATALIVPNEAGLFTFPQYIGNHTAVILGQNRGATLCTVSGLLDNERGLPLDNNFNKYLNKLRREKKNLIEIGLLASVKKDEHTFLNLLGLMVSILRFGVHNNHHDFVIGVHPRRSQFYSRVFGFKPLADAIEYDKMNDAPVVLMHLCGLSKDAQRLPATHKVYNDRGDLDFSKRYLFNPHNLQTIEFGLTNYTFSRKVVERSILFRRSVFTPAPIIVSKVH